MCTILFCDGKSHDDKVGVLHTEKGVREYYRIDFSHRWVIDKIWIYEEEYRHIDCFASIQSLLLKAETLNFAEIRGHLTRRHTIGCHADYIFVTLVRSSEESKRRLSR